MNKRIAMMVGLIAVATMMVSADPWTGRGLSGRTWDDVEEQTLSGRIQLEADTFPILSSGGEEYILDIHPVLADEVTVRNGQQITVEGYVFEVSSRDLMGSDNVVRVTAVEVDGSRVVLPNDFGGWGGHHGMMGDGRWGAGRWGGNSWNGHGGMMGWDDDYGRRRAPRR